MRGAATIKDFLALQVSCYFFAKVSFQSLYELRLIRGDKNVLIFSFY